MLWDYLERKLVRSKRTWAENPNYIGYRFAELFCEACGESLGVHDIANTNLETAMYCKNCVSKYIKETPIHLDCGTVVKDYGTRVILEYRDSDCCFMRVSKVCYFNRQGRFIKVKGKRYYI